MGIVEFISVHLYRTIALGTFLVGLTCGALGAYLYLRRQALLADVIGHASTLGVMAGFMFASTYLEIDGRSIIVLVVGSVISCLLAVGLSDWVARTTPIKHDTSMAVMLALFYGGGLVLLRLITNGNFINKGGITAALLGRASALTTFDVQTVLVLSIICIFVVLICRKEFAVFCFDPIYAATLGFSSRILGPILLGPTVLAVVLGVKAVGLILMVAFAVIPPAIARQWTKHVGTMVFVSAVIGGLAATIGTWISITMGNIPTGPVIVLVLTGGIIFSLLFAPGRSLLLLALMHYKTRKHLQAAYANDLSNLTKESASTNKKVLEVSS